MPIIYYDGNCVYCYNYAIWLIQNELPKQYQFATLEGEVGKNLFQQYPEARNQNSVIVQEGDRLLYRSTAIAYLIRQLPNNKRWLGILLTLIPKFIRNYGYHLFADNRDKMWKTSWHKPNDYEASFFLDDNAKIKLTD